MVRLILFDIDGTLIRTGGAGVKAFERTFATEFGIPNATEGASFAGRTDPSLVREILSRHGVEPSPANFERFYSAYPFWLESMLQQLPGGPCEGVLDFIRDLHALPEPPALGLLTGNIRLGAEIKLRHYNLWNHFCIGAFGDDHEDRNELARVARSRARGIAGRDLADDEIVVIGDTEHDIRCGQCISARVIAVGTGIYTAEQLAAHKPTWSVPDLRALPVSVVCGKRP